MGSSAYAELPCLRAAVSGAGRSGSDSGGESAGSRRQNCAASNGACGDSSPDGIAASSYQAARALCAALVNETGNPKASFAVQPVGAPTPLLLFDAHTPEVAHRKAGLLNLAKGQYALKALDTGRVLCTITIR